MDDIKKMKEEIEKLKEARYTFEKLIGNKITAIEQRLQKHEFHETIPVKRRAVKGL